MTDSAYDYNGNTIVKTDGWPGHKNLGGWHRR